MDKTLADTLTANLKSAKTPEARAFEVLRAFCAAHGDTLKEWTEDM